MLPKNIIVAAGWHQYKCAQRLDPDTVITIDITPQANADYSFNLCNTTGNLPHNYFDLIFVESICFGEKNVPELLKNMLINIKKLLNKNGLLVYQGQGHKRVPALAKETGFANTTAPDLDQVAIAAIDKIDYQKIHLQLDPDLVKYFIDRTCKLLLRKPQELLPYESPIIRQNYINNFNEHLSDKIKKYENEITCVSQVKLLRLIELYIFRAKNAMKEKNFRNSILDLEKAYKLNTEKVLPYPLLWTTSARILKKLIKNYIDIHNSDKANELFSLLVQLYEQNSDPFTINNTVYETDGDENKGMLYYQHLAEFSKLLKRSEDYKKFSFLQIMFTIYEVMENNQPISGEVILTMLNTNGHSLSDLNLFIQKESELLREKQKKENAKYINEALAILSHIHNITFKLACRETEATSDTHNESLNISSNSLTLSEEKPLSNEKMAQQASLDVPTAPAHEKTGETDLATLCLSKRAYYGFFPPSPSSDSDYILKSRDSARNFHPTN